MSKIILLGPAFPLRGGLASYNERLARALQDNGDEVFIHTFSLQYPSVLFPGKTQYSQSPPPEDLRIKESINSIQPFNWLKVGNRIKKEAPDLLIIQFWLPFMGPCFGTIARRIRKNGYTKVISVLHNIIPHEKRPGDRMLTRYFLKPVEGFIVQSESVIRDLKLFDVKKPVIFNPHPLYDHYGPVIEKSVARKRLGLDPDTHYLLFFGFIRDYKGLDLLLKAMGDKRISERNLKLIVAGEYYGDPEPYRALIRKLGISEVVIEKTDFIPDEEVFLYFNACDVVVQPYKNATQSGVTQIAYHFNKPMIVTCVGGLPEMIPDGRVGYVVEPEPEAIAEAIDRFYKEEKEEEFSGNAAEEKKKYDWSKMVENIYRLAGQVKSNS